MLNQIKGTENVNFKYLFDSGPTRGTIKFSPATKNVWTVMDRSVQNVVQYSLSSLNPTSNNVELNEQYIAQCD